MSDKVTPIRPEEARESVVLKNGDCNNRVVHGALEKLDGFTGWKDTQDMWRFNKVKSAYDRQSKVVRKNFQKLLRKHAVMAPVQQPDPNDPKKMIDVLDKKTGKPATTPKMVAVGGGRMDYVFREQAAFDKDYADLMNQSFTITAYKLPAEDLISAGLTPKELRACGRLIHNIDPDLIEEPVVADEDDTVDDDDDDPPADTAGSEDAPV